MSKYIKLKDIKWHSPDVTINKPLIELFTTESDIADLTTIDIVRCKNCKHRSKSQWITNLDGTEKRYKCDCIGEYMLECNFCSFGERIDNE